jgi:hypothetical protein
MVRPSGFEPPTFCSGGYTAAVYFHILTCLFWTLSGRKPGNRYRTAAFLIATTLVCAGFRFAAVMIFSESCSSTSETCWLGT